MENNPSIDQVFVPMISYEDGVRALEWLAEVFGCLEKTRWLDENGLLSHGELDLEGQLLMLATPVAAYQSPNTVRANYPPSAKLAEIPYVMDGVLIYVRDLDAVLDRARRNGGVVLSEVMETPPGRRFRLEDPEGHRWYVFER